MNGDAIQVVSQALQDRLTAALAAATPPIAGTVFVGPLNDANAAGAALVVFLYRIAINPDLRSDEHRLPPATDGGPPEVRTGGLPLDLYYLLTVGSAEADNELEGLRTLGFAMQSLNDSPNLVGVPVEGETVRLSLDAVTSEEMSRVWTLFPTENYRTSVIYIATPVWIDPAQSQQPATPVIREPHRFKQVAA
jgi:hypothetical protein